MSNLKHSKLVFKTHTNVVCKKENTHTKNPKDLEYSTTCIKREIGVIMRFYPYRRCLGMPGEI